MRILYRAIAILVLWMATSAGATAALTEGKAPRQFTAAEHKCLAEALWHERGSTTGWSFFLNPEGTRFELRLMAYSIKVRAMTTNAYFQRDWGAPDLCAVIKKRVGHVCQYSYNCMKHDGIPISAKDRWEEKFQQTVVDPIFETARDTIADFKDFAQKNFTELYKWNEVRFAVADVLHSERPWQPPVRYVGADTYQTGCSEPKYYIDSCDKRIVSSARSKCWFSLEEVLLEPEGPLPLKRSHAFYRRVTLEEAKQRIITLDDGKQQIRDVPAICEKSPETVKIVLEAWKEWIQNPNRALAEKKAEVEEPEKAKTKRQFRKKKKKPRG